ncbi:MAG: DUF2232 domain-containing protein [Synergistaceae bacterium]
MTVKKIMETLSWIISALILYTSGIGIRVISPIALIIAPVPFFVITKKFGIKTAFIALALTLPAALYIGDIVGVIIFIFIFSLLGIACSYISDKAENIIDYAAKALFLAVISKVCLLVISVYFFKYNPFIISPEFTETFVKSVAPIISGTGIKVTPQEMADYAKSVSDSILMLMPTMLILFSILDTTLSYYLITYIFRKNTEIKLPKIPPFGEWKCPQNIFIALIASVVLELLAKGFPEEKIFAILALNLMEVTRGIFIIEGLSIMWYFMTKKNIHKIIKLFFVIFALLFPPLSYIMSMLGIFDIWYDLRRKKSGRNKDESNIDKRRK